MNSQRFANDNDSNNNNSKSISKTNYAQSSIANNKRHNSRYPKQSPLYLSLSTPQFNSFSTTSLSNRNQKDYENLDNSIQKDLSSSQIIPNLKKDLPLTPKINTSQYSYNHDHGYNLHQSLKINTSNNSEQQAPTSARYGQDYYHSNLQDSSKDYRKFNPKSFTTQYKKFSNPGTFQTRNSFGEKRNNFMNNSINNSGRKSLNQLDNIAGSKIIVANHHEHKLTSPRTSAKFNLSRNSITSRNSQTKNFEHDLAYSNESEPNVGKYRYTAEGIVKVDKVDDLEKIDNSHILDNDSNNQPSISETPQVPEEEEEFPSLAMQERFSKKALAHNIPHTQKAYTNVNHSRNMSESMSNIDIESMSIASEPISRRKHPNLIIEIDPPQEMDLLNLISPINAIGKNVENTDLKKNISAVSAEFENVIKKFQGEVDSHVDENKSANPLSSIIGLETMQSNDDDEEDGAKITNIDDLKEEKNPLDTEEDCYNESLELTNNNNIEKTDQETNNLIENLDSNESQKIISSNNEDDQGLQVQEDQMQNRAMDYDQNEVVHKSISKARLSLDNILVINEKENDNSEGDESDEDKSCDKGEQNQVDMKKDDMVIGEEPELGPIEVVLEVKQEEQINKNNQNEDQVKMEECLPVEEIRKEEDLSPEKVKVVENTDLPLKENAEVEKPNNEGTMLENQSENLVGIIKEIIKQKSNDNIEIRHGDDVDLSPKESECLEKMNDIYKEKQVANDEHGDIQEKQDFIHEEDYVIREEHNDAHQKNDVIQEEHDVVHEVHNVVYESHKIVNEEQDAIQEENDVVYEVHNVVYEPHKIVNEESDVIQEKHDAVHEEHNVVYEPHKIVNEEQDVIQEENDVVHEEHNVVYEPHKIVNEESDAIQEKHDIVHEEHNIIYEPHKIVNEEQGFIQEENDVVHEEQNVVYEPHKIVNEESDVIQEKPDVVHEEHNVVYEPHKIVNEEQDVIQEENEVVHEEQNVVYEPHKIVNEESDVIQEKPDVVHEEHNVVYEPHKIVNEEQDVIQEENEVVHEEHNIVYEPHKIVNEEHDVIQEKNEVVHEEHNIVYEPHKIVNEEQDVIQEENEVVCEEHNVIDEPHKIVNKESDVIQEKHDVIHEEHNVVYEPHKIFNEEHDVIQEENDVVHDEHNVIYEPHKIVNNESDVIQEKPDVIHEEHNVIYEPHKIVDEEQDVIQEENDVIHEEHNVVYEPHKIVNEEQDVIQEENEVVYEEHDVIYEPHKIVNEEHDVIQEENNVIHEEHNVVYEPHKIVNEESDVIQEKSDVIHEEHNVVYEPHKIVNEEQEFIQEENEVVHEEHNVVYEPHKIVNEEQDVIQEKHDVVHEEHNVVYEPHKIVNEESDVIQEKHDAVHEEHNVVYEPHKIVNEEQDFIQEDHDVFHEKHKIVQDEQEIIQKEHIVVHEEQNIVHDEHDGKLIVTEHQVEEKMLLLAYSNEDILPKDINGSDNNDDDKLLNFKNKPAAEVQESLTTDNQAPEIKEKISAVDIQRENDEEKKVTEDDENNLKFKELQNNEDRKDDCIEVKCDLLQQQKESEFAKEIIDIALKTNPMAGVSEINDDLIYKTRKSDKEIDGQVLIQDKFNEDTQLLGSNSLEKNDIPVIDALKFDNGARDSSSYQDDIKKEEKEEDQSKIVETIAVNEEPPKTIDIRDEEVNQAREPTITERPGQNETVHGRDLESLPMENQCNEKPLDSKCEFGDITLQEDEQGEKPAEIIQASEEADIIITQKPFLANEVVNDVIEDASNENRDQDEIIHDNDMGKIASDDLLKVDGGENGTLQEGEKEEKEYENKPEEMIVCDIIAGLDSKEQIGESVLKDTHSEKIEDFNCVIVTKSQEQDEILNTLTLEKLAVIDVPVEKHNDMTLDNSNFESKVKDIALQGNDKIEIENVTNPTEAMPAIIQVDIMAQETFTEKRVEESERLDQVIEDNNTKDSGREELTHDHSHVHVQDIEKLVEDATPMETDNIQLKISNFESESKDTPIQSNDKEEKEDQVKPTEVIEVAGINSQKEIFTKHNVECENKGQVEECLTVENSEQETLVHAHGHDIQKLAAEDLPVTNNDAKLDMFDSKYRDKDTFLQENNDKEEKVDEIKPAEVIEPTVEIGVISQTELFSDNNVEHKQVDHNIEEFIDSKNSDHDKVFHDHNLEQSAALDAKPIETQPKIEDIERPIINEASTQGPDLPIDSTNSNEVQSSTNTNLLESPKPVDEQKEEKIINEVVDKVPLSNELKELDNVQEQYSQGESNNLKNQESSSKHNRLVNELNEPKGIQSEVDKENNVENSTSLRIHRNANGGDREKAKKSSVPVGRAKPQHGNHSQIVESMKNTDNEMIKEEKESNKGEVEVNNPSEKVQTNEKLEPSSSNLSVIRQDESTLNQNSIDSLSLNTNQSKPESMPLNPPVLSNPTPSSQSENRNPPIDDQAKNPNMENIKPQPFLNENIIASQAKTTTIASEKSLVPEEKKPLLESKPKKVEEIEEKSKERDACRCTIF